MRPHTIILYTLSDKYKHPEIWTGNKPKQSMQQQVASVNALANVWEAQHKTNTCTYLSEDHASKRILVRALLVLV